MKSSLHSATLIGTLLFLSSLSFSCADEASDDPIGVLTPLGPEVGEVAPNFALPGLTKALIRLSDYRGTVVLVDFWASWCEPCIEGLPELKTIWEEYRNERFVILGVSRDYTEDAWKNFVESEDMDWIHVYEAPPNKSAPVSETYGVQAIPWSFLIDKEGVVRGVRLKGDELRAAIEEALSQ